MNTRKIGFLDVSVVGLGCNNFGTRIDKAATARVIDAALDAGVTLFDTADIYGKTQSETLIGDLLGPRRQQVVLATKFGKPVDLQRRGAHPAYIQQAVEDSLRRLKTDYIDLYQLHEPDPSVPIADTLGALDDLVRAGKVREIGCSNFSAAQLREAAEAAGRVGGTRFTSVQNEYSLLYRDDETDIIPKCERLGMAYLPYYPLASGMLTGKYRKGQEIPEGSRLKTGWHTNRLTDDNLTRIESLITFAESRGHTILELAFAWLLATPVVASVIAGATSSEQVSANAMAVGWTLTSADLDEIETLVR